MVILAGVILQLSFFSQITLLRVAPTSCPRSSSASACSAAAMIGAVCGFSVGLLIDCLLIAAARRVARWSCSPPATSPGLYRERFDVTSPLRAAAALHGR